MTLTIFVLSYHLYTINRNSFINILGITQVYPLNNDLSPMYNSLFEKWKLQIIVLGELYLNMLTNMN